MGSAFHTASNIQAEISEEMQEDRDPQRPGRFQDGVEPYCVDRQDRNVEKDSSNRCSVIKCSEAMGKAEEQRSQKDDGKFVFQLAQACPQDAPEVHLFTDGKQQSPGQYGQNEQEVQPLHGATERVTMHWAKARTGNTHSHFFR